jgi:hypothetical protein
MQCVFCSFVDSFSKMPFSAVLFREYIKTGKATFAGSSPVGHPTFLLGNKHFFNLAGKCWRFFTAD